MSERGQNSIYSRQNAWVSMLRIFMCLVVIQDHFPTNGNTLPQRFVAFFGVLAVPCFMFLSFYFMGGYLSDLKKDKIKERLLRLYIPILFWNTVYFLFKNAIYMISGRRECLIDIRLLPSAFFFCNVVELAGPLWFLLSQILELFVIVILFRYIEKRERRIAALLILLGLVYLLEYTGVASVLLEGRYPLGITMECLPYAICGLLYDWCIRERKFRTKLWIWIGVTAVTALIKIALPVNLEFGYGGFYLLAGSLSICMFVMLLPDCIKGRARIAVNWTAFCTMGIYCAHLLLAWVLNEISLTGFFQGTLLFELLIFLLGILVTFMVKVLCARWKWLRFVI